MKILRTVLSVARDNVCGNDYIDNDVKVRDHCHITWKYKGSAHRDFSILD